MPAYKDKKTGLFYVQFYYRDARGARRHKNKKGFQTELEALLWEKNFKALKALGRENVGDGEIGTLARNLTEEQAGAFLEESAGLTSWVADAAKRIWEAKHGQDR